MQRRVNPFLKASYESYSNEQKRYFIEELLYNISADSYHEILDAQFAANSENLRAIGTAIEARRNVYNRPLLALVDQKYFLSLSFSKLDNDHRAHFINFLLDAYALDSSKAERIHGYQDLYIRVLEKQRSLDGYNIALIRQAITSHAKYRHQEHQDLVQSLQGFGIGLENVLRAEVIDPAVNAVATQLVKRLRELGVIPVPVPSIFDGDYADLGAQERNLFIRSLLAKSPAQRTEILTAQRVVGANNVVELAEDMKVHRFDFIGDNPEAYRVVEGQVHAQVELAEEQADRMEDVVAPRQELRLAEQNRPVPFAALSSNLFAIPVAAVAPAPSKEQMVNELLSAAAVMAQRNNAVDPGAQAKTLALNMIVNAMISEDVNTARDLLNNNNALAVLKNVELVKITENALKYLEQKVQASVNRPR